MCIDRNHAEPVGKRRGILVTVAIRNITERKKSEEQLVATERELKRATGRSLMEERALHVLLVEDNMGDVRLLRDMFVKERPDSFKLTHHLKISEAEAHLAEGGVDIVLLNMGSPDGHGLETVRRAHAAAPNIPMIVLTGLDDEALAAEAMKAGAHDYLVKGQIENRARPRALRHAVERHRMQVETDLVRTQQLQLKDEFLSHVSHELRSPLTSIYSFSTIIADGLAGATSSQQDEYLAIILRNVQQLQSMIEDLLEVTQARTGKLNVELQCTSISESITYAVDTLRSVARAKAISISLNSSETLPFVYADPTRLRQILTILLDNATKFTPSGGAVSIESRLFEDSPDFLLLEISDTGCGIVPEMTERIFEHLYQVADASNAGRKGLGLGLHIARELVTRMGGKMWVTSELLKGSHFFFTVPVFSLRELILPVLVHERRPGETIAMLAVEIHSGSDSADVPREFLDIARKAVQQCLRPDADILLPYLNSKGEHTLFVVAACTQEQGAEIIVRRIQTLLEGEEQLQLGNLTFVVSHRFLDPATRSKDESMALFVERVAGEIQGHIYSACFQRSI